MRYTVLLAAVLWTLAAQAGHGLMNSFADIEWLGEAGVTPDSAVWRVERWLERSELYLAATPAGRQAHALDFARERLAELEAMVKLGERDSAARAAQAYGECITVAAAARDASGPRQRTVLATHLAHALLEHQYILSIDYLDLPPATRGALAAAMVHAEKHYGLLRTTLPETVIASLFFKEEEVRWSWEMAQSADQQGL